MNSIESYGVLRAEFDTLLHILSNQRRRLALRYLCEHGETTTDELADALAPHEHGETTTDELADALAPHEHDKPEHQLRAQDRKRVYIALYQTHLPKMEDAGLITYEDHVATPCDIAHQIWGPLHELEAITQNADDSQTESLTSGFLDTMRDRLASGGDPA